MNRSLLCTAIALLTAGSCLAQTEKASTGLAMQAARADGLKHKGKKAFYPADTWDLSDLPAYKPAQEVSGTIRMWGSNYITDGNLGQYWVEAFQKFHPHATIEFHMLTTRAAVPSLVFGVSDLGIGRKITTEEQQLYERYKNHDPIEISIATGSYNVTGWQPAFGIVVNKDNPLTRISLDQLDGVYGSERNGGWVGTDWHPEFARGPEKNIRTWGQLGLTGEWADQTINPYGLNQRYHQATEISDWILRGSDKWNEHLKIYANYVDGSSDTDSGKGAAPKDSASDFGKLKRGLNTDLVKDRYGIAYVSAPVGANLPKELKALEVGVTQDGPFYPYTMENLRSRKYPLFDQIYAYADAADGKSLDPKVREFLRFVVSREGQDCVERDGKYLPLTAEVSEQQLKKLE